jgi:excisionase family DNA binding protein
MVKTHKELVSISKAARLLGVSIDTVRRWDKSGKLQSVRPDGKNRHFKISEIKAIKAKKETRTKPSSTHPAAHTISAASVHRQQIKNPATPKPAVAAVAVPHYLRGPTSQHKGSYKGSLLPIAAILAGITLLVFLIILVILMARMMNLASMIQFGADNGLSGYNGVPKHDHDNIVVEGGIGGSIKDKTITAADIANGAITSNLLSYGLLQDLADSGAIVNNNYYTTEQTVNNIEQGADGDITSVSAGAGLGGGGNSGAVTLNVKAGNGITTGGDVVGVKITSSGTTSVTSSNSGLEVNSAGLRLLGGCADSEILKYNNVSSEWECATDGGSGGSITVRESDLLPTVLNTTALEFGPAISSSDEFIVTDQGGGVARIRLGSTVLTSANFAGTLDPVYVNVGESPAAGDITGSFSGGLFIAPDSVALGTDTTGNYLAGITAGNGLSGTASGEGITPTLNIDFITAADGTGATSSNSGFELAGAGGDQLALLQGCSNNQVLKWDDASSAWGCATDSTVSALAWSELTDPTANLTLDHGTFATTFNWGAGLLDGVSLDAMTMNFTSALADIGTQRLLVLENGDDGVGLIGGLDRMLVLDHQDTNEALSVALEIISAAGGITTAIDVTDADIGTALSFGANNIIGTNFTVTGSSGNVDTQGTIQAGSSNVTITTSAGNIDADAIGLITGDGAGSTSSGSGLETDTDRLGMLQGCSDNEILKWNNTTNVWFCAADNEGISSLRYKDNVENLEFDTEAFMSLDPKTFQWKSDGTSDIGFIAEEVAEIMPELATYKDGQVEGLKYGSIYIYTFAVVKDHELRLDQLEEDVISIKEAQSSSTDVTETDEEIDGQDIDLSNLEVGALRVELDLIAQGAMVVEGPVTFKEAAKFLSDVSIAGDVTVQGNATFKDNTAGYASIAAGQTSAFVSFSSPHPKTPIVTVSLGDGGFARYSYRNVTPSGFEIVLQEPAEEQLNFSWTAVNVE